MKSGFPPIETLDVTDENSCKSKANATKSFKILSAPPILTLHLKRFSVSYSSYGKPRANKNTQFVEYPESLDIAPYMVDTQVNHFLYCCDTR